MSGINHLYDIYNKKGKEFVDQLFNTYVTVNEKMDGSAFTFERDKETGKFKFYRRDQRNPITLVDRTLMKYYEKPIQYIESLPPHILEQIPRGWRFGLEYFANTKPVEITYDRIPKNHLLLSYVHEYGDDGKIKKTIQDKGELDNWADLLGVDRAPIIFQGYLTDDQKDKITDFLRTPFEGLVQKFKTQSFVRYIISTLNPKLTKTALNDDLDKDVEGIVFRFGEPSKENEPVLAKMVDPVFTQMAKDKSMKQREDKPSDFLGIALMDVMNFILEKGVDDFRVDGDSEDERYISFMSDVFAKFLDKYSDKYRGADFEEPEYLKREEFRLNKDLVDDRRVLKYVNDDDSFESLFKLMLNSFRKIKSRASGIVTKGMMEQMNLLIRDIKDYIEKPRKGKLNESSFLSFLDFRKEMAPSVQYLKEEDEETEADENPFYSYKEFITALETIDNTPKGIVAEADQGKLKDVNLIVGRFQPFHDGHLKMAKFLKEKNGNPSVAVVVYPGHNKSGKSPFNEDTIKKYMDGVIRDEKEVIDYIIVQRGLIGSAIVKLLEKGYKPNLIGAGEDRMDDYTKQLEYVKKSDIGDQMQDLKLVQTPRVTSATKVREAIKDGDYSGFKKLVPKAVDNVYDLLKTEMKSEEGKMKESHSFGNGNEEFETIYNMYEAKIENKISLEEIGQEVDFLKKYIDSLTGQENLTADQIKRISSISAIVNRIKNLARDSKIGEEELSVIISDLLFGSMGDKKSLGRKRELAESLLNELSDSTITNLIDRYVNKKKDSYLTISNINAKKGIHDINGLEFLNGISGKDLRKIYNFDAGLATGNSKRGKGESLFSIAFDAGTNVLAGGDVVSREDDRVVEIKSTTNAAITPKSGDPISPAVYQILKRSEQIYGIPKISKENPNITLQKNDSVELINKIKDGGDKAKDFLDLVSSISKIDSLTADDVLPVILLLQTEYYSKDMEEFQTLAVFVENKEFPDKLVIIESTPGIGFVTKENIDILKKAGIAPKVTFSSLTSANKVEIYRFDRK
jgi:hypothetical protein